MNFLIGNTNLLRDKVKIARAGEKNINFLLRALHLFFARALFFFPPGSPPLTYRRHTREFPHERAETASDISSLEKFLKYRVLEFTSPSRAKTERKKAPVKSFFFQNENSLSLSSSLPSSSLSVSLINKKRVQQRSSR